MRRFMIVSHRWLSLVLGIVLLALTTSGAILIYRPELQRAMNHTAYAASGGPATTTLLQARATVLRAHPTYDAETVIEENGVYRVTDFTTSWTVDPATGKILGEVHKEPGWLGFLDNFHECGLSCEDYPGYVAFLAADIPHTGWLGYEGSNISGGGLLLGVFGLLLLYLCLTGIWLWFPRPSAWRSSMDVRWRRGRFARDTDLHKVAGMIAIPLLLVWAVTAAGFELGFMEKAWYAVTPGTEQHLPDAVSAEAPKGTPDVSPAVAVSAAQALHPRMHMVAVDVPSTDDATASYIVYFQNGYDPYEHTEYPGDLGVSVDRHTGKAHDFYGAVDQPVAQDIWGSWSYPVHSGYIVNGWWGLIWFVFALSPLLLAVTGVSTWLVRHSSRKRRRAAVRAGGVAPAVPAELAEELGEDPEKDPELAR